VTSVLGGGVLEVARLDRLEVGPIAAAGVMPSVLPEAPVGIDGILGQDVLAAHRYTIDYRERRIVWSDHSARGRRARSTFALEPRDGRFIVSLPYDDRLLSLVPDSGAATLLLFDDPGRAQPPLAATSGRRELQTLTARRDVTAAVVRELRVGDIPLRNVPAVLVERPEASAAGTAHDGLLPLHLFDRVTIDGPNRLITLER
jgi:hypothetical protein